MIWHNHAPMRQNILMLRLCNTDFFFPKWNEILIIVDILLYMQQQKNIVGFVHMVKTFQLQMKFNKSLVTSRNLCH